MAVRLMMIGPGVYEPGNYVSERARIQGFKDSRPELTLLDLLYYANLKL